MSQKRTLWKTCTLVLMLFSSVIAGVAQELCEELSREIFQDTDDNCAEAQDQNVCYGFDSISATFFEDTGSSFSVPSDLVNMLQLQTLRSSEFDPEEEEWGIGYFRIDIEESDEPLIIMATGNVIIENDLDSAQNADINAMQAFNFTTGGPSTCQEAPNAVFIQSPDNVEVDLVVNSVPLRIGSTVVLGTFDADTNDAEPQDDTMWIAVVEGFARFNSNTGSEVQVGQGNASTIPLTDENGNAPDGNNVLPQQFVPVINPLTGEPILGPDGQPFYRQVPYQTPTDPQAITLDGEGIFNTGNYWFINNIPSPLLNYEVEVETEEPEETPTPVTDAPPSAPIQTEEPISNVDNNVTECGTRNWCNAGERWGDGRCNDPDPDVANWYWTGGWYNAQQECGAIEEIPEEFRPQPTDEPPADGSFYGQVVSCTNRAELGYDFVITLFNIPSAALSTAVIVGDETSVTHQSTATPPGPVTQTINVNYLQIPLIAVSWSPDFYITYNSNITYGELRGQLSC